MVHELRRRFIHTRKSTPPLLTCAVMPPDPELRPGPPPAVWATLRQRHSRKRRTPPRYRTPQTPCRGPLLQRKAACEQSACAYTLLWYWLSTCPRKTTWLVKPRNSQSGQRGSVQCQITGQREQRRDWRASEEADRGDWYDKCVELETHVLFTNKEERRWSEAN